MTNILRRGLNLVDGRDNYDLNLVTSIQKAVTKDEAPTKIKHVRSIIISTHHEHGASTFWSAVSKLPLQSQGPLCWKFCHVLHKLLREGHPNVIFDCMKYLTWLQDLGKVWSHLPENFGPLNSHYLKMLYSRLRFHKKHIKIPGNLDITDEAMSEITGSDANGYFEFSVELLDLMDDVMNLQSMVFHQMDRSRESSMTSAGQCKLFPLILSIQDSCQLYDCLVKMLFKLHRVVPADALLGHRERFLSQYKSAKQFYETCGNLQFFKGLIQVPTLPDLPPNFLIASDISKHKKPVARVVGEDDDDEPEAPPPPPPPKPEPVQPLVEPAFSEPAPDSRDTIISQLKTQVQHLRNELEFVKTKAREKIAELNSHIESLQKQIEAERQTSHDTNSGLLALKRKLEAAEREQEELRERLAASEENAAAAASLSKAEEHAKSSDERFKKMRDVYEKLKQEHVTLLRTNAGIKKQATAEKQAKEEKEQMLQEVKEELDRVKSDQSVMKESMQKSTEESSKHTTMLEQRIEELDKQKAEYEEKLMQSESENKSLNAKLSDYQATSEDFKQNAEKEKESLQQSSQAMGKELEDIKSQLEASKVNASELSTKNQELIEKLETVQAEKKSEVEEMSERLKQLEAKLDSIAKEKDSANEEKDQLRSDLESQLTSVRNELQLKTKEEEERLKKLQYGTLSQAVDKGVKEINYTLEFIDSEEFITHTCHADAAVGDLQKLDQELSDIAEVIDGSGDMMELSHLVHSLTHRICRTMEESKAACNRAPPEQGDALSAKCNEMGLNSVNLMESIKTEYAKEKADAEALKEKLAKVREDTEAMLSVARGLLIRGDDVNTEEIGEMVEQELNATQQAIQEGADKIQAMLEKSRARDTGVKLEVNEKILDAVTRLMLEIQQLVRKSKDLQAEIVAGGRGSASAKEFYKKNHRWTEGLVSAAKAVGWGASTLVEKAERIIEGKGTLNELKVCSSEIAASTAQLVVSSQVKADKESKKLGDLKGSAKAVKAATADVVASSNYGQQLIEESDLMNFSDLSLTQTKRVEMNTQVYILELESKLEKERKKLAQIRQRHYQLAGESEGWEVNGDGEQK